MGRDPSRGVWTVVFAVLGGALVLALLERPGSDDAWPELGPSEPGGDAGAEPEPLEATGAPGVLADPDERADARVPATLPEPVEENTRPLAVGGTLRHDGPPGTALRLVLVRGGDGPVRADVSRAGRWSAALVEGEWSLVAELADCEPSGTLEVLPGHLDVREDGAEIALALAPAQLLAGRVVTCSGRALRGATVRSRRYATSTDDAGAFVLPAVDGYLRDGELLFRRRESVGLEVEPSTLPEGIAPPPWQRNGWGEPRFSPGEEALVVLADANLLRLTCFLGDEPFPDPVLSVRGRSGPGDPDGRGAILVPERSRSEGPVLRGVPPGRYEAWLFGTNPRPEPLAFELDCFAGESMLELRFLRPASEATLVLRTIDGSGVPMPGLGLGVWRLSGTDVTLESRLLHHAAAALRTGPDGSTEPVGLPAGRYLVVRTPSHAEDDAVYVDREPSLELDLPRSDEPLRLDWVVERYLPASLRVAFPEPLDRDRPLAVEIVTPSGTVVRRRVLVGGGEASLRDLPPGGATLTVETPGGVLRARAVIPEGGEGMVVLLRDGDG